MSNQTITLFLCGDVMTGRGVDQILAHPNPPELRESWVRDAQEYVDLAERVSGPIPRPVDQSYIWGDALAELDRVAPDARIINLETSVTARDDFWPDKPIHYRMNPANIRSLTVARIDACALANNHVIDFGYDGLMDTLAALHDARIRTAGAGRDRREAERPAIVELSHGRRVILFSLGSVTSGVPEVWSAADDQPGVDWLPNLSDAAADGVLERVARVAGSGDVVVISIHWGGNWGYDVPPSHVHFAHRLLDGGVAVVHGHSSHHPRPIELYKRKLILYGCGDFLTDYEGIAGYGEYRSDLALMYFPTIDATTGALEILRMTPMRTRRFQSTFASKSETEWLRDSFTQRLGTCVEVDDDQTSDVLRLVLRPTSAPFRAAPA